MIVPGVLLPSSRVPGVCPGEGVVFEEIDTCIRKHFYLLVVIRRLLPLMYYYYHYIQNHLVLY